MRKSERTRDWNEMHATQQQHVSDFYCRSPLASLPAVTSPLAKKPRNITPPSPLRTTKRELGCGTDAHVSEEVAVMNAMKCIGMEGSLRTSSMAADLDPGDGRLIIRDAFMVRSATDALRETDDPLPAKINDTHVIRASSFILLFNSQHASRTYYAALDDGDAGRLFGFYARELLDRWKIGSKPDDEPKSRLHLACMLSQEPSISVEDFATRICRVCCMGMDTVVAAVLYMERLLASRDGVGVVRATPTTIHQLMIVSSLLACKYLMDSPIVNSCVAIGCGIRPAVLNGLEVTSLWTLKFSLLIEESEFYACAILLECCRIASTLFAPTQQRRPEKPPIEGDVAPLPVAAAGPSIREIMKAGQRCTLIFTDVGNLKYRIVKVATCGGEDHSGHGV
jgi:hypothetical protein